jgi:hypothetical protein
MSDIIKYRVFKKDIIWCNCIYFIPEILNFFDIIGNNKTKILTKNDYIGKYIFDINYLKILNKDKINDIEYYYSYHLTDEDKTGFTKYKNFKN